MFRRSTSRTAEFIPAPRQGRSDFAGRVGGIPSAHGARVGGLRLIDAP